MDSQRKILFFALLFVTFVLYLNWTEATTPQQESGNSQTITTTGDVPHDSFSSNPVIQSSSSDKLITITTDVLTLTIDTLGGDVIKAVLNDYDAELDSENKFILLDDKPNHIFVAQSGLIGQNGIDTAEGRAQYSTTASDFTLESGADKIEVPLTVTENGIVYTKLFTLTRGSYAVDVKYVIDNNTSSPATVQMYAQLKHSMVDNGGSLMMSTYTGGVYSADDETYQKYSFGDMQDQNLSRTFNQSGWVAMMQHYFVAAWVPEDKDQSQNHIYSSTNNGAGIIGVRYPMTIIEANSRTELDAKLWVGPKLQDKMAAVAPNLELTVDYGWLWFIASPLHWLLATIHGFVGNWGVAIILLTLIVRGVMFPLTKAQYTSMAKMRMLQPKLQEMKERIGDDRQRMSMEMMELYKREKVNPLGGCLPLLLQMPIFIALYWALMESVELRHAPFILWIHDLSAPDPYYVLPLLMGVSMFFIQKMSPTTIADPMQQKIMTFMPVLFTVFFLWFPAGLVLYWLVSNIVTLIQQAIIFRSLEKKGLHTREKKTKAK